MSVDVETAGHVQCPMPGCGRWYIVLNRHLRSTHGVTPKEVLDRYPGTQLIADEYRELCRSSIRDIWLDRRGYLRGDEVVFSRWDRNPEAVIAALRRDARRRGRPPKFIEWTRATTDRPCATVPVLMFGSWNAALTAAGLETRPWGGSVRWTRERIIAALRAEYEATGKEPSARDWGRGTDDHPSAHCVIAYFGTWNAAVRAAGMKTRKKGHRRKVESKAQIITALRREHRQTGRVPSCASWGRRSAVHPSSDTVKKRFGSWNAALVAAGLPTRQFPKATVTT